MSHDTTNPVIIAEYIENSAKRSKTMDNRETIFEKDRIIERQKAEIKDLARENDELKEYKEFFEDLAIGIDNVTHGKSTIIFNNNGTVYSAKHGKEISFGELGAHLLGEIYALTVSEKKPTSFALMAKRVMKLVEEINHKSEEANNKVVIGYTELLVDHARLERLLKEFFQKEYGIDVQNKK